MKDQLDARGVRLIGIAGEHLGRDEFLQSFWKGELFFDLGKKTFFPAVHGGKKKTNTAGGIFSAFFGGAVSAALKRSAKKGVEGNMKGEGFTLGGVWVVHPTEGVVFEYREKHWGDSVTENELQGLTDAINKLPGKGNPVPVMPIQFPAGFQTPNMVAAGPCGPSGC